MAQLHYTDQGVWGSCKGTGQSCSVTCKAPAKLSKEEGAMGKSS